jgi:hypothetical protein
MKKNILVCLFLCFTFFVNAQLPNKCGVTAEVDALIKQRMLDNRAKFSKQQIFDISTNRSITYIPVSFHSVSNTAGEGAASEKEIFAFLCGLNGIYADQSVQFFIYNQINFRTSDAIDDDASTNASAQAMNGWSVTGTLNITIGRSQNNPSSSWYSGFGDYIFLLKQMMSPQAKTEAHEIGHFFTMPHTFYGWEGLDAEADYGGQNVPSSIGSGWGAFSPEAVPRTGGQANCTTAGDGFCGTEADYYSSRTNCPYMVTVKDPFGNSLDPDESNIMSYALDACVTTFSADQKTAISLDIAQRSWLTNTPNGTTDLASVASPSALSPVDNGQLGPVTNPTVRLEWTQLSGAAWHYVEVYGTIIPNLWVPNVTDVIYRGYLYNGNNYFDLPTSNLQAGKYYVWRVTPLSNYSTCANPSSFYKFEASSMATSIEEVPLNKWMSLDLLSNPVNSNDMTVKIYTAVDIVGSVMLYSMDGRKIIELDKLNLQQGNQLIQVPVGQLSNGIYMVALSTKRGTLQTKLVIQR